MSDDSWSCLEDVTTNLDSELMRGDLSTAYDSAAGLASHMVDLAGLVTGVWDDGGIGALFDLFNIEQPLGRPRLIEELVTHITLITCMDQHRAAVIDIAACRFALAAGRPQGPVRLGGCWHTSMAEAVVDVADRLCYPASMPALKVAVEYARQLAERLEWRVDDTSIALGNDAKLRSLCDQAESDLRVSGKLDLLTGWMRETLEGFDPERVMNELEWEFARATAMRLRLQAAGAKEAPDAADTTAKTDFVGRLTAQLLEHPDWTNTQLAKGLGLPRSTFLRWVNSNAIARAALQASRTTAQPPHGIKDSQGNIEAWDERIG